MTEAEQYYQWRYTEPNDTIVVGNAKRWGLLETEPRKPVVEVCPPESEPKCYGRRWEDGDEDNIDND